MSGRVGHRGAVPIIRCFTPRRTCASARSTRAPAAALARGFAGGVGVEARGSAGRAAPARSARRSRSSPRCRCTARLGDVHLGSELAEAPAQLAVGRDAAADRQAVQPRTLEGALGADDQALDDRGLEGGGEVGGALGRALGPELADRVEQRRLQPGEREVEPLRRTRLRAPPRAASPGEPGKENASGSPPAASFDSAGPAREPEPEHPRALVERLARGVVERPPEHLEAVVLGHERQQRVPAARDQAHERGLERRRRRWRGSWPRRAPGGGRPARTAAPWPRRAPCPSRARPAARRRARVPAWRPRARRRRASPRPPRAPRRRSR